MADVFLDLSTRPAATLLEVDCFLSRAVLATFLLLAMASGSSLGLGARGWLGAGWAGAMAVLLEEKKLRRKYLRERERGWSCGGAR